MHYFYHFTTFCKKNEPLRYGEKLVIVMVRFKEITTES